MNIYLASSWKNEVAIKGMAEVLREDGHAVDAFCDASNGRFVFSFNQLPDVSKLNAETVLMEPAVQRAFAEDKKWIDWSDCVVLVLPSGRSAHLEAGYAKGARKKLAIYAGHFPNGEFDVMYGFADIVTDNRNLLRGWLRHGSKHDLSTR